MRLCAVILAGGRSSRMGREKALETIGGRSIIVRIAANLAPQADAVVINANGDAKRFATVGLEVIPDLRIEVGMPLAGLHAALSHATSRGFDAVLTVPCDTPFLPGDLVSRLCENAGAAVAASAGQVHYLTGFWPTGLLPEIEAALRHAPLPRVQDWVRSIGAAVVEWPAEPYDPFFNVNNPDDLAEASRIAAEFLR